MKNSFAKIDMSEAKDTDSVIRLIDELKAKLNKTANELKNQHISPNYKYLINYMVGSNGISFSFDDSTIHQECQVLGERLVKAGVKELQDFEEVYAEFTNGTLEYLISSNMDCLPQLVIKGSDIRFKGYNHGVDPKKKNRNNDIRWSTLDNSVTIYINRLELTEEDIEDHKKRQIASTAKKLSSLGITVDDNGVFIIK